MYISNSISADNCAIALIRSDEKYIIGFSDKSTTTQNLASRLLFQSVAVRKIKTQNIGIIIVLCCLQKARHNVGIII